MMRRNQRGSLFFVRMLIEHFAVRLPTSSQVCNRIWDAGVYHMPFGVLISAEEDYRSWKGPKKCRRNSTVKTFAKSFLPEDLGIG